MVAVAHEAARRGHAASLPDGLPAALREALAAAGITALYGHQRAAYDLLADGHNVVVSTGTASGKSLCYQLAVLDAYARDPQSRALLLFPTKALAQDQARKLAGPAPRPSPRAAGLRPAVPAIYDGDTPMDVRAGIRRSATILLSNPDMLHLGILPSHERWAEFLHHLRFVVLDEAHVYRGVFGSHVAQVIRRLRRLCAHYGGDPAFVLTSATIAEPQAFAERLVGVPFAAVDEDQAPRPERTVVFWNPPLEDPAAGTRRSALAEASYVTAESVLAGARVIAFAPTRKAAELIYGHVRRRLEDRDPGGAARRVSRTAPATRRSSAATSSGACSRTSSTPSIATQALELGIDVGSLDVSLVTGFPGHGHQPAPALGPGRPQGARLGRARGRPGRSRPVLHARAGAAALAPRRRGHHRPAQPAHLGAAPRGGRVRAPAHPGRTRPTSARRACSRRSASPTAAGCAAATTASSGACPTRRRPRRACAPPATSSSSSSERRSGELIGTVERERVFRFAHPGAVYLHLGRSYLVTDLDLDGPHGARGGLRRRLLHAGQGGQERPHRRAGRHAPPARRRALLR